MNICTALLVAVAVAVLPVGVPEVREPPTDVEVTEGDSLRLRCAISASQRPFSTVWWLHNAVPVISNEFTHITGKHLMNGPDGVIY